MKDEALLTYSSEAMHSYCGIHDYTSYNESVSQTSNHNKHNLAKSYV